jgi:cysteine desulfurase
MSVARPIYLDNAATTRPLPSVVEAMAHVQYEQFGNPSSKHAYGPPAKKLLDDAREFLRGTLGAAQIIFTSGGSEADYLGIVGAAAARQPGRVLLAQSDHPAVLETTSLLARQRHHISRLPVTRYGDFHPEQFFAALGPDVRVISLLHGHNELGTLCELEELISLARRTAPDVHVHVDLVQSYGKIPFDLDAMDVDSVAVSGHKFHGPRGAGFLALSSKARIAPLQVAGGQEEGMRGGTENVAGAVGLMLAAEAALSKQAGTAAHTRRLASLVADAVFDALPEAQRLGHPDRRLPHILSLWLPGITGETLMLRCDERGLAFSTGAACHGAHEDNEGTTPAKPDNHVLAAIGMDRRASREVIRLSFSRETTDEEAERAAQILVEEAQAMLAHAPRGAGYR